MDSDNRFQTAVSVVKHVDTLMGIEGGMIEHERVIGCKCNEGAFRPLRTIPSTGVCPWTWRENGIVAPAQATLGSVLPSGVHGKPSVSAQIASLVHTA